MTFISESSLRKSLVKGKERSYDQLLPRLCGIHLPAQKSAHGVLQDVEKEIREHYAENITLREMSQKFFINNAYLGQMFKKNTVFPLRIT